MNLAEIATDAIRQVGPWPEVSLTTHDIANLLVFLSGGGLGIIAASDQGCLSRAAGIVGIGFSILCLGWGMAADNPELLRGAAIESVSFVAGYFGMALSRQRR